MAKGHVSGRSLNDGVLGDPQGMSCGPPVIPDRCPSEHIKRSEAIIRLVEPRHRLGSLRSLSVVDPHGWISIGVLAYAFNHDGPPKDADEFVDWAKRQYDQGIDPFSGVPGHWHFTHGARDRWRCPVFTVAHALLSEGTYHPRADDDHTAFAETAFGKKRIRLADDAGYAANYAKGTLQILLPSDCIFGTIHVRAAAGVMNLRGLSMLEGARVVPALFGAVRFDERTPDNMGTWQYLFHGASNPETARWIAEVGLLLGACMNRRRIAKTRLSPTLSLPPTQILRRRRSVDA